MLKVGTIVSTSGSSQTFRDELPYFLRVAYDLKTMHDVTLGQVVMDLHGYFVLGFDFIFVFYLRNLHGDIPPLTEYFVVQYNSRLVVGSTTYGTTVEYEMIYNMCWVALTTTPPSVIIPIFIFAVSKCIAYRFRSPDCHARGCAFRCPELVTGTASNCRLVMSLRCNWVHKYVYTGVYRLSDMHLGVVCFR